MVRLNGRHIKGFYNKNHSKKLTITEVNSILRSYLTLLTHRLVVNAEQVDFFGIGTIKIIRVARPEDSNNAHNINWGLSNKLKKEITERGGTPLAFTKNEKGEPISNEGEPWKIKYDNSDEPFYVRTSFRTHRWVKEVCSLFAYYSIQVGVPFKRNIKSYLGKGEVKRKRILQYDEQFN